MNVNWPPSFLLATLRTTLLKTVLLLLVAPLVHLTGPLGCCKSRTVVFIPIYTLYSYIKRIDTFSLSSPLSLRVSSLLLPSSSVSVSPSLSLSLSCFASRISFLHMLVASISLCCSVWRCLNIKLSCILLYTPLHLSINLPIVSGRVSPVRDQRVRSMEWVFSWPQTPAELPRLARKTWLVYVSSLSSRKIHCPYLKATSV